MDLDNTLANSHTHCQATQANAKSQAWQRVWLSQHTNISTDKPTDEKEHRSDNITYTQAGVLCFAGQFCARLNICASYEHCLVLKKVYSLTE